MSCLPYPGFQSTVHVQQPQGIESKAADEVPSGTGYMSRSYPIDGVGSWWQKNVGPGNKNWGEERVWELRITSCTGTRVTIT